jgi:hypothetical protein
MVRNGHICQAKDIHCSVWFPKVVEHVRNDLTCDALLIPDDLVELLYIDIGLESNRW